MRVQGHHQLKMFMHQFQDVFLWEYTIAIQML